jgi:hypothetical protein
LDHNHQQSDSDGIPGINESEDEDDDDSRFDDNVNDSNVVDQFCDISKVIVSNAGNEEVNGNYMRDGICEGAHKFSKNGVFNGSDCTYSLFKCNVSNNTQHWYISVVPHGTLPGTSNDIDFYSASVTPECHIVPPSNGWNKAAEGTHPPPSIQVEKEIEPTRALFENNSPSPDEEQEHQQQNVGQSFV